MHAVGARARLSTARCLSSQPSSSLAQLSPKLRHRSNRASLLFPGHPSRRHLSNNPNGATEDGSVPDKPNTKGETEGEAKGEETQAADNPEVVGKPHEAMRQALFPTFGRLRAGSSRDRTSGGLPPVTLPQWFLDEDVVIFDEEKARREKVQRCVQRITGPLDDVGVFKHLLGEILSGNLGSSIKPHMAIANLRDGRPPNDATLDPAAAETAPEAESVDKETPGGKEEPNESQDEADGLAKCVKQATREAEKHSGGMVSEEHRLSKELDEVAWNERHVDDAMRAISAGDYTTPAYRSELFLALLSVYTEKAFNGTVKEKLNKILGDVQISTVPGMSLDDAMDDWRYRIHGEKIMGRPDSPRELCQELLSTVSAELDAKPPPGKATREVRRRPVSLLSITNYSGGKVAKDMVNDLATDLEADVIHLDAAKLARIVGPYLGQTSYYGRGNIAMLGYLAAEANGRTPSTPPFKAFSIEVRGEDDEELQHGSIAKASPDESWDDLKLNHVLKEIVRSTGKLTGDKPGRLILHLHDYVELNTTSEGASLVNSFRNIVDRQWQNGSSIVLLGSSSIGEQSNISFQCAQKFSDISKEETHFIVHRLKDDHKTELQTLQGKDCLQDNLRNVSWMLESMTNETILLDLPDSPSSRDEDRDMNKLISGLSELIRPVDWVYRFATQILGMRRYNSHALDSHTLLDAFKQMKKVDLIRLSSNFAGKTPLQSMFGAPKKASWSIFDQLLGDNPRGAEGQRTLVDGKELDDDEKKLLSGLVNRDDIKTTFDDVVAPPEIRESLMGLTTLSLQHPDAFSYGVLARERIHGCLLYGPPGTGKTLMAKAVAKESGANMLEISAASINDMWVGSSEKNVRAVFSLARKMSPMVVFLDEAESLLGSRGRQPSKGGYKETINQFLREWDGLTNSLNDSKTFIMVATNRPFDLDEAILRRLPRRILVDLPLRDARLAILQSLMRDEVLDASVSLEKLAIGTELYSGSDLKNMCVAAAMEAAKEELKEKTNHKGPGKFEFKAKRILTSAHFDKALKDISASISEDMESLKAIRKFDERYGDARKKKKKGSMGFEIVANKMATSEEARVRQAA